MASHWAYWGGRPIGVAVTRAYAHKQRSPSACVSLESLQTRRHMTRAAVQRGESKKAVPRYRRDMKNVAEPGMSPSAISISHPGKSDSISPGSIGGAPIRDCPLVLIHG